MYVCVLCICAYVCILIPYCHTKCKHNGCISSDLCKMFHRFHMSHCRKSFFFFLRFYFIFRQGREGEREGEKHQCVVASCTPPTGNLAHNPGMCPDWDSNQWTFSLLASTQSTEPHQPGPKVILHSYQRTSDLITEYRKLVIHNICHRWSPGTEIHFHTDFYCRQHQRTNVLWSILAPRARFYPGLTPLLMIPWYLHIFTLIILWNRWW